LVHAHVLAGGPGVPVTPPGTLIGACDSSNPGIACRLAWDLTHSARVAEETKVYFAGPTQLAIRIGFVILVALLLRLIAHRAISRITAHAAKDTPDGRDRTHPLLFRERRRQRAAALGAILSNAASLTIFGIAAVMILGDMGFNLAPVLASAGVLGVALGFGAQNLVQDFLAGIFMLLEDQYGVGDVVDVGGTSGTIEAVSLRITRLRDVNGVVWHIRNGAITKAGNKSQGWARAVVDFPVPYRHDIPQVRRVMARTATAMWQEPAWQKVILEEPEVWGVQTLYTDAVLLRVVARTEPLRQWEVQRELTERLKNSLDATGADSGGDPGAESDAPGARSFDCPPSPATAGAVLGDASAPQPGPPAASEVSHPGHVT
jgi:moderate conductance mechanosensitive channel